MAGDSLRLVTIAGNGRPVLVLDLNTAGAIYRQAGSFQFTPPTRTERTSTSDREFGGARVVGKAEGNAALGATFVVVDQASPSAAAAKAEDLLAKCNRLAADDPVYLEWIPQGLTRGVYFPVRGPATVTSQHDVRGFAGANLTRFAITWPIAPLAEGLPLDVRDDLTSATLTAPLGDYTQDQGGTLTVTPAPSTSPLPGLSLPTSDLNRWRLRHTGRGYPLYDGAISHAFITPAFAAPALLTRVGASKVLSGTPGTFVSARVEENGTNRGLYLTSETGGVETVLAALTPAALQANVRYWVRLVTQGIMARAELWVDTRPGRGAPDYQTAWAAMPAGFDGAGDAMFLAQPNGVALRSLYFDVAPFSFVDIQTPETFLLRNVPGNAPARVDVEFGSDLLTLPFGVIGWCCRTKRHNITWNGDLGVDADGWTTSTIGTGLTAGGTVALTAGGATSPYLAKPYARITTTATAQAGAAFRAWDTIRKGAQYTIDFYAKVTAGSWEVLALLDGTEASASVTPAGAGAAHYSLTFTAQADHRRVELLIRTTAATAGDLSIAALRMWEGATTDAPTSYAQTEGRGGRIPFGYISAEANDASSSSGFAAVTGVTFAYSPTTRGMRCAGTAGTLAYFVDPELLAPRAGDPGDIDVEVYAIGSIPSTVGNPRIVLRAIQESGAVRSVYTREYGSGGKNLVIPTSGTSVIAWRLGTLPFAVRSDVTRGRWLIALDYSASVAANFDLYHLFIVPVRRRRGSPSGKVNDATYPTFANLGPGLGKLLTSDGAGYAVSSAGVSRDASVGGEPLELEPGDNEVAFMMLTGGVADPPDPTGIQVGAGILRTVHARVVPRYRFWRPS